MLKLLILTSFTLALADEPEDTTQAEQPIVFEGDRDVIRRKPVVSEQQPPPPKPPVYEETESDRPGHHPK